MTRTFIAAGPYDFSVDLPKPPAPDPELVIVLQGGGPPPGAGSVRLTMKWSELARLHMTLTAALLTKEPGALAEAAGLVAKHRLEPVDDAS